MRKQAKAYRLITNAGTVLARVEGVDVEMLQRQIGSYSLQYVEECGSVTVQERCGKRWRKVYTLSAPLAEWENEEPPRQ